MVESVIPIRPVYLDKTILAGGVSSLEDDTPPLKADSRTVGTNERSDRVQQSWQLSWGKDSEAIVKYFKIFRNSTGFLFISPIDDERVCTGMPLKNTNTLTALGDGSTVTFQLQHQVSLSYDVGAGTSSSDAFDVNYPLASPAVVAKAAGTPVTVSSVNLTTGVVTLSAPPSNGAVMTADFERAIPVMFSSKNISRTLLQVDQTEVRSAQIEEII
jgi:uncharacterized protein (TIGR02217 family)